MTNANFETYLKLLQKTSLYEIPQDVVVALVRWYPKTKMNKIK